MQAHTPSPDVVQKPIKPEWIRVPDAVHISGLSRSTIYELIASGAIKSFCKRERGAVRGMRLIFYDSLTGYLESEYQRAIAEDSNTRPCRGGPKKRTDQRGPQPTTSFDPNQIEERSKPTFAKRRNSNPGRVNAPETIRRKRHHND